MQKLLKEFEQASLERKRLRKVIIRKLREHKEYFKMIRWFWLIDKMTWNYMGDLSDPKLMMCLNKLFDTEKVVKKEKSRKFIFDENNIIS
ncbi:MAG: hypothetical protein ACFFG0_01770 [Candidatus Thorarchaeota archaeon]